jgi:heme exporter protein CcmD
MQWHSLPDFLAMDGKALYIWGSYGFTFLCLLTECWWVSRRRKAAWCAAQQMAETLPQAWETH